MLHTQNSNISNGQLTEIYHESWKDISGFLPEVIVTSETQGDPSQDGANREFLYIILSLFSLYQSCFLL
jgi:hypothetical protein